jgi:hypothetical protein
MNFLHCNRCYERQLLDVVFERYMEADVAVEESEHQLQDLNMLSMRTQRPLKLLFKPHDFNGGSYISESAAAAAAAAANAVSVIALAHVAQYIAAPIVHILLP